MKDVCNNKSLNILNLFCQSLNMPEEPFSDGRKNEQK